MLRVRLALVALSFALSPPLASATDAAGPRQTLASRIEPSAEGTRPRWIEPSQATVAAPMQDLEADVSTRGLRIRSVDEGGDAYFDVTVHAFGREHAMAAPPAGAVALERDAIRTRRGAMLEEITADGDGIRQDFVLDARPVGAGRLALDLAFAGATLEALAPPDGTGVAVVLADGRRLHYRDLHVVDAGGHALPASMRPITRSRLRIEVDDRAAHYPIRIDPTFTDADWTALDLPAFDGRVLALVTTPGGDLYVGGEFSVIHDVVANRIARWNGTAWSALDVGLAGGSAASRVTSLAWDEAGGHLYAGGAIRFEFGILYSGVARWNGASWTHVGSVGQVATVSAVHWDGVGGRLYVGGSFTSINGLAANRIARWDGSGWAALGSGVGSNVEAIAVDGAGNRVFVGGIFTTAGGNSANRVAEWNGSAWSPLGLGTSGNVASLAWDSAAAALYVGGTFGSAGGSPANNVARWSGNAWSALGLGTDGGVRALQWDGAGARLIAAGDFQSAGGITVNRVARWNGAAWSAFGSGVNGRVNALALGAGGSFYAGGEFNNAVGVTNAHALALWNGATWTALPGGTTGAVRAVLWDAAGGRLFIGGQFTNLAYVANNIAQWNGSAWSALGTGVDGTVNALAYDAGFGRLYAAGSFLNAGGAAASRVAQWDGANWTALGSGVDGEVHALAWDSLSGGRLYVGGAFTNAGGSPASRVARWSLGSWTALGAGTDSAVRALRWIPGEGLFAGGDFTMAGGSGANFIARWTGSSWLPLGTGVNNSVHAIEWDFPGDRLFAGGIFTTAGGAAANRVAQWSGSAWSAVAGGLNNTVRALVYDAAAERLYAGGDFTRTGSFGGTRVSVWRPSTFFEWDSVGSGTNGPVHGLAYDGANGRLFVGGAYTLAGAKPAAGIARNHVGLPQAELFVSATPTTIAFGGTSSIASSGGSGSGAVDFQVLFSGGEFCSISGSTLTGVGAGSCLVRARKFGDATYIFTVSEPITVTVTKAEQAPLTVSATPPVVAYQGTSVLGATGGTGPGSVSFAVTAGQAFCSVAGNVLTGIDVGSCTVTGTKAGDANHNPVSASVEVTVTKAAQATLVATATPPRIPRNATSVVGASGGSGTGALSFALTAGAASCTLAGDTVTGIALGTCTVTVTKAADARYEAASASVDVTVSRLDQATLVATATPQTIPFGATSLLGASGGSGTGALSFAVTSGASSCTVEGATLTAIAVGTCTVTATKDGDAEYEPASATIDVEVVRATQGALTAIASPATVAIDGTSTLSASGGSGTGAVDFGVTAGQASCSVAATTLTGLAVGDCTVTATKAADQNHEATSDTVDVAVRRIADLSVSKDAGVDQARSGAPLVYAIVATNAGPNDVAGALLTDSPPAGLTNVAWACVPSGSTAACPPPPYDAGSGLLAVVLDLPAGTQLRYDFAADLSGSPGTIVSNTANLQPPAGALDPVASNSATDAIVVADEVIFTNGFE